MAVTIPIALVITFALIQLCSTQGPCPFDGSNQFVFSVGIGQGVWCSVPGASINMNNGQTTCSPGLTFTCDLTLPRTGTIGQDLFGGDLIGMPLIVSSSGSCYQKCAQTTGCVAWAFNFCGTNLQCWLKGSIPATRTDSCVVSATFVAPPATTRPPTLVPSPQPLTTPPIMTLPPPFTGSSCTCSCCLGNDCVASFQGYSGFDCNNCDQSCVQAFPSQCPSSGMSGVIASFCVETSSSTSGSSSNSNIGPFSVGVFIAILVGGLVALAVIAFIIAAIVFGWHQKLLHSLKWDDSTYQLRV